MKYIALLRGINVGGKNSISMAELKQCFEAAGFERVKTYINSGNVLFESAGKDTAKLARSIEGTLENRFGIPLGVTVVAEGKWRRIIEDAPAWWGHDETMKHNLIILLEPYDMQEIAAAIGPIRPEYEKMQPGDGVVYQSLSLKDFGRTVGGKLAGSPVYKRMTVRNYNTSLKLLDLLKAL